MRTGVGDARTKIRFGVAMLLTGSVMVLGLIAAVAGWENTLFFLLVMAVGFLLVLLFMFGGFLLVDGLEERRRNQTSTRRDEVDVH